MVGGHSIAGLAAGGDSHRKFHNLKAGGDRVAPKSRRQRLAFKSHTQTPGTLSECVFAAFKDVADGFAHLRILKSASLIGNAWQSAVSMRPGISDDDLVGVGIDDEVGIVGHHDYLAFFLGDDKERDELVENGLRIQVLFRLIDDERPVIGVVEGEVQKQKDNSASPGRKLGDVDTVIRNPVADAQMIGAKEPSSEAPEPGTEVSDIVGDVSTALF